MLFSPSRASANLDALFAEQFEPDGELHYLYRRSSKGAPIRVTAAERDKFVADFRRASRRLRWVIVGGVMLIVAGFVLAGVDTRGGGTDGALEGATALLILVFFLLHRRVWSAPARALERRPDQGLERSGAEMRRRMAERQVSRLLLRADRDPSEGHVDQCRTGLSAIRARRA